MEYHKQQKLIDRFWQHCPIGLPDDECWEWTGFRVNKHGYGGISVAGGKWRGAHVFSWEMSRGRSVPKGRQIMHTCDNPPCVNPFHLKLGTQTLNNQDRHEKGRTVVARGSRQGHSKLTEDQVVAIRYLLEHGVKQWVIAEEFGITQSNVSYIKNHTWRHVDAGT